MEIREAVKDDIPGIVNLLKSSLGESMMPKSLSFWTWKHLDNPFGQSPALVATDGGNLIGVRAFMRWQWSMNGKVWSAVRAVDTATHPSHQGKGVFMALTLALLEKSRQEGTLFVFNTPNKLSRPGYLRMGWRMVGRMPVKVRPRLTFSLPLTSLDEKYNIMTHLAEDGIEELLESHSNLNRSKLISNYSTPYLRWRYLLNPNVRYYAHGRYSGKSSFLFIFRVKSTGLGSELRICDAFTGPEVKRHELNRLLGRLAEDSGARFCTFAGDNDHSFYGLSLPIGPQVTVRNLKLSHDQESLLSFRHWVPSIGDMEVF